VACQVQAGFGGCPLSYFVALSGDGIQLYSVIFD